MWALGIELWSLWRVVIPSGALGHQAKKGERQMGQQKALDTHERKWRQISVNRLNCVPEYKEDIGLATLGANLICTKWHTPITRLSIWQ